MARDVGYHSWMNDTFAIVSFSLGVVALWLIVRAILRLKPRQRENVSVDFDSYKGREDSKRQVRKRS